MAAPASADDQRARVLAVCSQFLQCFGSKPPLAEADQHTLLTGFCILPNLEGPQPVTFEELIKYAGQKVTHLYGSGTTSFELALAESDPTIWFAENLAGLVSGYVVRIDGEDAYRGVAAFSFLQTDGHWKVVGLAGTRWSSEPVVPPVMSEPVSEIMTIVNKFFARLTDYNWGALEATLLKGSGATLSRRPQPPLAVAWPEFVSRLKVVVEKLPPTVKIEEKLHDCEVRWCGDVGFAWTPFVVEIGGEVKSKGFNIFILVKSNGEWTIGGLQDTHCA